MAMYGVCPVCGKPLSPELGVEGFGKADKKGKQKRVLALVTLIPRAVTYFLELAAFSVIGVTRPSYVICLNEECPIHYKGVPLLLKPDVTGIATPKLRGDPLGIALTGYKALFAKRKAEIEKLQKQDKTQGGG